jgi:hypothetical protein
MTSVNVSSVTNTVTVTQGDAGTTVVTVPQTSVVTATTAGPQGAAADISALEARVAALEALNILLLEG